MNPPRKRPGYRLEQVDEETVLYFPGDARVLYCNPTASLIWQLCDGVRTAEDIIAELAAAYPDAAGTIRADVEQTLATLSNCGALEGP
jgi:coenzyme PQQ biosynthesis protein PqqD